MEGKNTLAAPSSPPGTGGCSSTPLASHGRGKGVFMGGRAWGIPLAPEVGTALVRVREGAVEVGRR